MDDEYMDDDTDEVEYHIDVEIDEDSSIYDEVEEDMVEPLQEQVNKSLDMFRRFAKY
jgi:hypothetical protein